MEPNRIKSDPNNAFILGIDPGLDTTGYGVLEVRDGQITVREAGVLRTTPDESLASRIEQIYDGVRELITLFHPTAMAVEQLHSAYEHPQTAILMGHARGVICLAAAQEALSIASYRPTQVKKTLTGSGRATKDQMQRAVQREFRLKELPTPADVADALAVALCHFLVDRALRQTRTAELALSKKPVGAGYLRPKTQRSLGNIRPPTSSLDKADSATPHQDVP